MWECRCGRGGDQDRRKGEPGLRTLPDVICYSRYKLGTTERDEYGTQTIRFVRRGGRWCALGTLGVVGASAAPPATADATAVTQWNLIAVNTLTTLPGPAGGAPPASQINMGMVQGAVYDAVNAITLKHHRPYLLKRRFGNRASDEAAVATAAYLVLRNIVETVPQSITFPTRETLLASLASQYQAASDAIPDSPFKIRESPPGPPRRRPRSTRGRAMEGSGRPSGAEPEPWVLGSGGAERHDRAGPHSVGGRRQAVPDAELVAIPFRWSTCAQTAPPTRRRLTRSKRSAATAVVTPSAPARELQTYIAKWWQSTPVVSWNDVARQLIARTTSTPRQRPSPRDGKPRRGGCSHQHPGTTSTTSTSGGHFRRSAERRRMTTPRLHLT